MKINFDNIIDNTEKLFRNVSQQSIYEYYLNTNIRNGALYRCPFHKDHTASMGFKVLDNNTLIHKCFGCGATGNVVNFVSNLYNLSYGEAFKRILEDRHDLPKITTSSFQKEHKANIHPIKQPFSITDYKYWNSYYIPLELLYKYDISACKKVFYKKDDEYHLFADYSTSNPIYCYQIDNSYKIYRPLNPSKKGKWMSSTQATDIQGLKQLPARGDLLIITSSMKDVLVLKILGYNAIALGGEGNKMPDKILDYLHACYKQIIIFYDNDEAGIEYAKTLSMEIQLNYIHIPVEYKQTKDISDFIKEFGIDRTKQLIKELLDDGGRREEGI